MKDIDRGFQEFNEKLRRGTVKLGFDLDQSLINTGAAVAKFYNKKFGDNKTADDITQWWPVTKWLMAKGFLEDESKEIELSIWNNDEVLLAAEPYPYALLVYDTIQTASLGQTHIITHRDPTKRDVTLKSLREQGFAGHPYFIPEQVWLAKDKARIIKSAGITHFLEDSAINSNDIVRKTGATVFYCNNTDPNPLDLDPRVIVIPSEGDLRAPLVNFYFMLKGLVAHS